MIFSRLSDPGSIQEDGGKGYNLKKLTQNGLNVPDASILQSSYYLKNYDAPLPFNFDDEETLKRQCRRHAQTVRQTGLTKLCVDEMMAFIGSFDESARFAVRSSSTFEDLSGAAFAGQHETFLNVPVFQVETKIKDCLASLWNYHAVLYRRHQGFAQEQASMAVVIQLMVPGDKAGVAFSVDPVSGKMEHVLIEANYGIGESVVGGEAITDSWVVDMARQTIVERRVKEKDYMLKAVDVGLQRCELKGRQREAPCLNDEEIFEVARQAGQLMRLYAMPQDIEWVFKDTELFLLQSRPQTTIPCRLTRDESAERFPEPLTPLTWSYVEDAFNCSLEHSLTLMDIHLPTRPWFCLKNHYVYGNQNAVQLMALYRPFYAKNFDELMREIPMIREKYQWVQSLPQDWMRDLDQYLLRIGELRATQFDAFDCARYQKYFQDIFQLAKDYFKPNIAISMTQAILTQTLAGLIQMVTGDAFEAHDLLKKIIAVSETKTGQINKEVFRLAQIVKGDSALASLLKNRDQKNMMADLKAFPGFLKEFNDFIARYGHREISFDYYQPTWSEVPEVVLDLILLTATSKKLLRPVDQEREIKRDQLKASQHLYEQVPESLHFFLHEVIRLTINFTFLDDLEHFQTTRINQLARRAIKAFGRAVQARTEMEDPLDLFFLERGEFESIESFALSSDLLRKMAVRKQAFLDAQKTEPVWSFDQTKPAVQAQEGVLVGVPGSPGECEGDVYLVRGPRDFIGMPDGAILVARTTNPAWTPLFYKAVGIVTESGGPLSHGAVTARELGLPAVMAVRDCFKHLSNGQTVKINGREGVVYLEGHADINTNSIK